MKIIKHIIILHVLIFPLHLCEMVSTDLIKDFFKHNKIQNGFLLTCLTWQNTLKTYKRLSNHGLQINIFEPSKLASLKSSIYSKNYHKTGIVFDLKCENSINLLANVSSTTIDNFSIFSRNYYWLMLTKKIEKETVSTLLSLNINIDAEILLALANNVTMAEYDIYEVYNTGRFNNGKFIVNNLGVWREKYGFSLTPLYKYARRSNMTGVVLKCTIVLTNKIRNQDFIDYLSKPTQTHLDSMNRFNYALLLHLRDIFNFSYSMVRTNSWGYFHNGTFDGMIGQLERKLTDIGGSPTFFRAERAKVIDYTVQTWLSRPCFLFRSPLQSKSVFSVYLRPFEDHVWYCVMAFTLVITLYLYLLTKSQNKLVNSAEDSTWSFAILFTLGAIFQQGTQNNLQLLSGKILILTIFIFAILIYQFYSASIVSSLLMEPSKSITTLEDLYNSNLKIGVENILYTLDYFEKTNDNVARKLFINKIVTKKHKHIFAPLKGLGLVKEGGFAFHVDIATAYKTIYETFTEREICELSEIQLFPAERMVTVVQKGSPFRKLVTYGLRKIYETGLMAKQRKLWHARRPQCIHSVDPTRFKVTLTQFSSALTIMAAGIITSLVIFFIEMKLQKIVQHRNRIKSKTKIYKVTKVLGQKKCMLAPR